MRIIFSSRSWEEYTYWQDEDVKVVRRLNELLRQCTRTPFTGTGKPEPLKGDYRGWWSRRLTDEDRLVYRVTGSGPAQALEVLQCRFHY